MKKALWILLAPVIFYGCEKEKDISSSAQFHISAGSVLIGNEGNFQQGNATITYFNPENGELNSNGFASTNQRPLGDICQSMSLIDGKLFVVVNNSGKIEVCSRSNLRVNSTITGLTSPRYIQATGTGKAFVSDTYSGRLTVISLSDYSVTGSISIPGWTEQMLLKDDIVFVTNVFSEYLYAVDIASESVQDSILISKGGASIVEDKFGKLWVLCGGDYLQTYTAALHRIDPVTKQVELSIQLGAFDFPSRLCINATADTMYFLNNGIVKMAVSETSVPSAFISSTGKNFYGLGIDKARNEIYVSDAIDYVQRGKIYRYQADGTEIGNFLADIIPGDFLFMP